MPPPASTSRSAAPTPARSEKFAIGAGCEFTTARPGYLYAYPNDAFGFYGNNSGAVTVTRI